MEIIFKKMKISNFRSIRKAVLDLHHGTVRNIIGVNLDEGGSNGSGKTNLLHAFCWCLYGETFPKIPANNVVHDIYKKDCKVSIEFTRDGKDYIIERYRNHHKYRNKLRILEDGEDISFHKTNQIFLDSLLNLNFKLFHFCNIFQTEKPTLFKMQESKRKDFFEEFIKEIQFFRTKCFNKTKEVTSETNKERSKLEKKLVKINSDRDVVSQLIDYKAKISKKWGEELKGMELEIAEKEELLDKKNEIITKELENVKLVYKSSENEETSLTEKLDLKMETIYEKKQEKTKIENKIKYNDMESEYLLKDCKKIEDKLRVYSQGKCPVCYTDLSKYKAEELEEHLEELNKEHKEKLKKVSELIEESGVFQKKLEEINGNIEHIVNERTKLAKILNKKKMQREAVEAKIKELKNLKIRIKAEFQILEDRKSVLNEKRESLKESKKELKDLAVKLKKINKLIGDLEDTVREHDNKLSRLELLKKIFRIIIPNILIMNCSDLFESYCNEFLENIDYKGLTVIVDSNKTEEGEIDRIKLLVMKSTGSFKLFNELSGGEKQRLILAEIFAMKRIIEDIANVRYNILWLDEILDISLDTTGILRTKELLLVMAKNNNYSIELISHITDLPFENKLTIRKEGGWSVIQN